MARPQADYSQLTYIGVSIFVTMDVSDVFLAVRLQPAIKHM